MKTADHEKTFLLYWIWFDFEIQKVWKKIRYFVNSTIIFIFFMKEFVNLLLKILWLYSVNVTISIKKFRIEIDDSDVGEKVNAV